MEILRECEIVGRKIETYPTIPSQAGSKTYGCCTLTHNALDEAKVQALLDELLALAA